MSTVELSFSPLPAHVRTARLIASAVARRVGIEAQVLDEVRLAVGEACTRAVELHRRSGVTDLIRVSFTDVQNALSSALRTARGLTIPTAGAGGDASPMLGRPARDDAVRPCRGAPAVIGSSWTILTSTSPTPAPASA